MNEVLQQVVELARPPTPRRGAQSCGVSYDVRVETGPIPRVAGTAEELREAFLNLLNNALDAMPAGGRFTSTRHGGQIQVVSWLHQSPTHPRPRAER